MSTAAVRTIEISPNWTQHFTADSSESFHDEVVRSVLAAPNVAVIHGITDLEDGRITGILVELNDQSRASFLAPSYDRLFFAGDGSLIVGSDQHTR